MQHMVNQATLNMQNNQHQKKFKTKLKIKIKTKIKTGLSALSKAVISSLLVSSTLLAGSAYAQSGGGGVLGERLSTVKMPNAQFIERVIDLRVKVLGGEVKFERTWSDGSWRMNEAWSNLAFYQTQPGGPISDLTVSGQGGSTNQETIGGPPTEEEGYTGRYISRANTVYELSDDNSDPDTKIYVEILRGHSFIRKTQTGWRWYDREGNWINYDRDGRLLDYGERNGVTVKFLLDSEGRRTAILDHHNNIVMTFGYVDERLVTITDNDGRQVLYHWDGDRMTGVTDVEGHYWGYAYDKNGDLILCTQPDGASTILTIKGESAEKKGTYFNSHKNPEYINSDGSSSILTSRDTVIVEASLAYAMQIMKELHEMRRKDKPDPGRIGTLIATNGAATVFNIQHNKTSKQYTVGKIDELGKHTVEVYDNAGNLLSRSVNGDLELTREFSNNFSYLKTTDERGLSTSKNYNEAGKVTQITHPNGAVETYTYDNTFNRPLSYTNPLGIVTQWTYDDKGNALTRIDAVGKPEQRKNSWTYDQYGQALTYTIGEGDGTGSDARTLHYTYDANGNIKTVTDALGNTTTYAHNKLGQVTSVTNALGDTWQYEYTPKGHLKKITNPLGDNASFEVDAVGRPIKMTEAQGKSSTVAYSYHNKGLTVTQTDALGNKTVYQLDPGYRLTQVTLPSGDSIKQNYDAKGRLKESIDSAGKVIQTAYGTTGTLQAGLPVNMVYPTYEESYQYNALGLPTEVKQALGEGEELTTRMSYNALGMLLSSTLASGATNQLQYDAFGHQVKHIDALGGETQQTYDAFGNVISVKDAKGNVHRFEYDKNGNLVKEMTPAGEVSTYAYNELGQLSQSQDAVGNTTKYEYNAAGLMVKQTLIQAGQSTPEQTVTYAYDKNGSLTEVIKNSQANNSMASDVNTRHVFVRDEVGRVVREDITYINTASSAGGGGNNTITKTLRYAYDADGRTVSMTYPDGSVQTAIYEQGRLKEIKRPDGEVITQGAYEWQRPGEVNAPGVKQALSYDGLQRTKGITAQKNVSGTGGTNSSLIERSYTYDAAGNIVKRGTEEGEYSYSYDLLDRLKLVTPPESAQQKGLPIESYAYDAVHNRMGSSHQAGEWVYNENNQLLKFGVSNHSSADETVYTYTANGHVATETKAGITKVYGYDASDRLVRVTSKANEANEASGEETEIARYAYDSFGRRISKTVHGARTYFVYSAEGLIAELNEGGDITRAYGWEPDTMYGTSPLWQAEVGSDSKVNAAQFHTLLTDHLGTPQMAVNRAGEITWKGVSESFGQTLPDAQNLITMNLRFPGQYFDEETGTHYNYFRDYQPITGRYIQKDPIGLEAGINVYSYVFNQPLGFVDIFGLAVCRGWRNDWDKRFPPPGGPSNWHPNDEDHLKCSQVEYEHCIAVYKSRFMEERKGTMVVSAEAIPALDEIDKCIKACKEGLDECSYRDNRDEVWKQCTEEAKGKYDCWTVFDGECKENRNKFQQECVRRGWKKIDEERGLHY